MEIIDIATRGKRMKRLGMAILGILLCAQLGGCGKPVQQTETVSGYVITKIELPDPNEDIPEEEEWIRETQYTTVEGTIIRISVIQDQNYVKGARYIQTLSAPYEKWKTYEIEHGIEIGGQSYAIVNQIASAQGDILLLLGSETKFLYAKWKDGSVASYREIPMIWEASNLNWAQDDKGNSYFYSGTTLYVYNEAFEAMPQYQSQTGIEELVQSASGKNGMWIADPLGVNMPRGYRMQDWSEIIAGKEMSSGKLRYGKFAIDDNDGIYFANREGLYRFKNTLEAMAVFLEQNIWADEINDLQCAADNTFYLLAADGGKRKLLIAKEGEVETDKRQEIVIAGSATPFTDRVILDFNKTNKEYYVTMIPWDSEEGATYNDFANRIQLEVTTGGGPDLIEEEMIRLNSFAKNGYLMPLTELLNGRQEEFVDGVLESGKVGEEYYMVPYAFDLYTMMALNEVVGDRQTWTLPELWQIAEEKEAEIFFMGARAWDIIYSCVAMDEESNRFVDWEQGISHLGEEEFIELLKLSKQYADSQRDWTSDHELADMKERRILSKRIYGFNGIDLYAGDVNEFGDQCTFIGFPVENGRGTMIGGRGFVMNASSKCQEGAIQFLNYLTSWEVQDSMRKYTSAFPANKKALEGRLQEMKKNSEDKNASIYDRLTEEQIEVFWNLLENSRPLGKQYADIINILYEETDVYYNDARSAEDTAKIIDNRVQLYLDENS